MDRLSQLHLIVKLILLSSHLSSSSFVLKMTVGSSHLKTGESVILRCRVSGQIASSFNITWTKGPSQTLPASIPRYKIMGPSNSELIIYKSVSSDSGEYYCHLNGQSALGRIEVLDPPVISYHPDVYAITGQKATLTCRGKNYDKIYWRKNKLLLSTYSRLGEILVIEKVSFADAGIYYCEAKNPVANITKTITLLLKGAPEISADPMNQIVTVNDATSFTCNVTGVPDPTVQWLKNGRWLSNKTVSHHLTIRSGKYSLLLINNVQEADEGNYYCVGTNEHGLAISETASLTVVKYDRKSIKQKTILFGFNFSLTCSEGNSRNMTVSWLKDGRPLMKKKATGIKQRLSRDLMIPEAKFEHSGIYQCEIFNGTKWTVFEEATNVTVQGIPYPPEFLSVRLSKNRQRAYLNWSTSSFDGNSPVFAYEVYGNTSASSLEFRNITSSLETSVDLLPFLIRGPGHYKFLFMIKSFNKFGMSELSKYAILDYLFFQPTIATGQSSDISKAPPLSSILDYVFLSVGIIGLITGSLLMIKTIHIFFGSRFPVCVKKRDKRRGRNNDVRINSTVNVFKAEDRTINSGRRNTYNAQSSLEPLVVGLATVTLPDESHELVDKLQENNFAKHCFQESEIQFDESIDFIGAGGYGQVFKAQIKETKKVVALKIISTTRRTKEKSQLLQKEARILFNIKPHPHILRFFGIYDTPICFGLVTEYICGGDLAQLLASPDLEIRKWTNRLLIASQVAMGMAHLHAHSPPIIHLDLKSNNVLIEKTCEDEEPFLCKICDFGLAKMANVSSLTKARPEGNIPSGTLACIAPERYEPETYGTYDGEEKTEVAKKSDVYCFGVLLWEIRERERPFQGMAPVTIHLYVQSGQKFPKGIEEAPCGYNDLLEKCVNFDPTKRPLFAEAITCLNDVLSFTQKENDFGILV